MAKKLHIIALVLLSAAFVLFFSLFMYLEVGFIGVNSEAVVTTPTLRYYWVIVSILFATVLCLLVTSFFVWRGKFGIGRLYLILAPIPCAVAVYHYGKFYTVDIPFRFKMDSVYYEVPWEYGPDARTRRASAGAYLRVSASYPDFRPLKLRGTPGWVTESRMRLSRQTNPDYLCFGDIGCNGTHPRSSLTPSQQLAEKVNARLRIVEGDTTIQYVRSSEGEGEGERETIYFYQNGHHENPRMYGLCHGLPRYMVCVLLLSDEKYFYNIYLSSNRQETIRNFKIERDLQLIAYETIKLFDSFLTR